MVIKISWNCRVTMRVTKSLEHWDAQFSMWLSKIVEVRRRRNYQLLELPTWIWKKICAGEELFFRSPNLETIKRIIRVGWVRLKQSLYKPIEFDMLYLWELDIETFEHKAYVIDNSIRFQFDQIKWETQLCPSIQLKSFLFSWTISFCHIIRLQSERVLVPIFQDFHF